MRTDAASAAPLKAHDAAEKMTKKPKPQNNGGRLRAPDDTTATSAPQPPTQTASPLHEPSPAQFRQTKPENWNAMSANQKANWRRYHKINA